MGEIPEYEKYLVSGEEMGKRYKNWTGTLASEDTSYTKTWFGKTLF
jgi:hypothetical protein